MAYNWTTTFKTLFTHCAAKHQGGNTDFTTWFTPADKAFLSSIGCREQEFFDFVDDHCRYGAEGPTLEAALLITAVRRDYFLAIQKGQWSAHTVAPETLPAKSAEVDGIRWLPRLIVKARAKLRGEMDPDTMFGCGGDRAFLSSHDIHPADFLRQTWAAGGDDQRILDFVKSASH